LVPHNHAFDNHCGCGTSDAFVAAQAAASWAESACLVIDRLIDYAEWCCADWAGNGFLLLIFT